MLNGVPSVAPAPPVAHGADPRPRVTPVASPVHLPTGRAPSADPTSRRVGTPGHRVDRGASPHALEPMGPPGPEAQPWVDASWARQADLSLPGVGPPPDLVPLAVEISVGSELDREYVPSPSPRLVRRIHVSVIAGAVAHGVGVAADPDLAAPSPIGMTAGVRPRCTRSVPGDTPQNTSRCAFRGLCTRRYVS